MVRGFHLIPALLFPALVLIPSCIFLLHFGKTQ